MSLSRLVRGRSAFCRSGVLLCAVALLFLELPLAARADPANGVAAPARSFLARLEAELERDLGARFGPVNASAASSSPPTADLLPQAREFYERLLRQPLHLTPPDRPTDRAPASREKLGPPGTAPTSSPLLSLALSYRGAPYRWGGASRDGLDCSGLIVRAAADAGRRLPHSAALLYQLGQPIADDDLQPGDLVFFRNTYKPGVSHVGIYQQGSQFFHASSAAGEVTAGDLTRPYYRQKYAGARRLSLGTGIAEDPSARAAAGGPLIAPFRFGLPQ